MIVFSNDERIVVTLDTGDPNRPAIFYFRPMTLGEFSRISNLKAELEASPTVEGKIKLIADILTFAMTGWSVRDTGGADVPYQPETLIDWLPRAKVNHLVEELLKAQSPSGDDRGK